MYTNEHFEDRRRIIKMEKEINELKEEKRIMKIEMKEMRMGREGNNQINKGEQKRIEKIRIEKTKEKEERIREKIDPPLLSQDLQG